jgi:hypothetical protein
MSRRQAYVAFCVVSFAVVMFFFGKFISWGLAKWDWWFWGISMACIFAIAFLIEAAEKRSNRRRGRSDSEGLE